MARGTEALSAVRPPGMPDALAAAMGYREGGDSFPGLEQYRQPTLRVGLCGSLSFGRLRALLGRIGADHPDFQLQLADAEPASLAEAVAERRIDIGFIQGDVQAAGCKVEALWTERLMVLLPEHHALAGGNAVGRDALRRERLLAAAVDGDRAAVERAVAEALGGQPQSILWAAVQRETLFNLVALGFGVAIAPASSLGAFYPGVVYRPFEGRQPTIPISCLWRADNLKPELQEILDLARHHQQDEAGR